MPLLRPIGLRSPLGESRHSLSSLVDTRRGSPPTCPQAARSLLRHSRLAKGFSGSRRFMIAFGHQFDGVLGVKLKGLDDRCPRVVNAVRHRVRNREI
jgi:hypothetical protein